MNARQYGYNNVASILCTYFSLWCDAIALRRNFDI